MSLEGKSLCVLTPMYGGMCAFNYHFSFSNLIRLFTDKKVASWSMACPNGSVISMARNELSHYFLNKNKATHALLVDSDIGFDAEDVLGMLDTDYDVIGVPCTRKSIRWDRVKKAILGADRDLTTMELVASAGDPVAVYENPLDVDVYEPQPMLYLGTGLLLVKREVFEILRDAYPSRWYHSKSKIVVATSYPANAAKVEKIEKIHEFFTMKIDPQSHEFVQEDYGFCRDCRTVGINPVMFPWIKTTHWGGYLFVGDLPGMAALTSEI